MSYKYRIKPITVDDEYAYRAQVRVWKFFWKNIEHNDSSLFYSISRAQDALKYHHEREQKRLKMAKTRTKQLAPVFYTIHGNTVMTPKQRADGYKRFLKERGIQ